MNTRSSIVWLATAVVLATACGDGSDDRGPSVTVPSGSALAPGSYSFVAAADAPPEREPGFDIVGPVWDIEGPAPPEGELLAIELPTPNGLPPDADLSQLKIASFHPAVGDGIPFWVMAEDVEYDQQRGTISTQARGVGLFAAAIPNDYWTTKLSRDGNYRVYFVADSTSEEAAEPEYVSLLIGELEDARKWIIESGYLEPSDTVSGPQPVYLVPLIGGPGLTEPSRLGSIMKLDNQLYRSPNTIPSAVTHELFHLSQRQAMFGALPERTWITEATAEYVTVQRLGISAARPHIDTSCDNFMRSVVDTRGINEYHNWTFVAFLEHLRPGFVRRFFESADGSGDGVDTLRELAGIPLNQVFAKYAGSYRLQQDYLPGGNISCPAPASVPVQALDGRAFRVPSLAGLVVMADLEEPREVTLTIERTGDPEVVLWGFLGGDYEQLQLTGTGSLGGLTYNLGCDIVQPDDELTLTSHVTVVIGTGQEPTEIEISVELGEPC